MPCYRSVSLTSAECWSKTHLTSAISYWLWDHDEGEGGLSGPETDERYKQDKERSQGRKGKRESGKGKEQHSSCSSHASISQILPKPINAVSWAALIGSNVTGLRWKWSCSVILYIHGFYFHWCSFCEPTQQYDSLNLCQTHKKSISLSSSSSS